MKYPNKSHRKNINFPSENIDLAELMGIIAGDGGINNDWQLVISLNFIKDFDYSFYIINLLEKLFKIKSARRKRPNQNTLVVVCSSTSLVEFLIKKGAVKGNKIRGKIDIPLWIQYNHDYLKHFVRGVIDTDGCIYVHKHKLKGIFYKNIGLCFTNLSLNLILSVSKALSLLEIKHSITDKERRIYIYGLENVTKYLSIVGSSNPRLEKVFYNWKGARVVESTRLESVRNRKITGGSNPPPSAT